MKEIRNAWQSIALCALMGLSGWTLQKVIDLGERVARLDERIAAHINTDRPSKSVARFP